MVLSNLGLADVGDAASQQIKRKTPAQPRAQQHTRDEPAMLRQRSSVNYSENFAAERACPATSSSAELGQTALTIRQPFASGIMLGHKTVENRSWGQGLPLPANGAWIVVHAAKEPADAKDPNLAALREAWTDMPSVVELPRGAVLGWMCVRAVVPHGAAQPHPELAADRQASGPWCWLIDRVARLAQPVEDVPGAQSLWAWPAPPSLQVPPGVTPWMRSAADRADRAENAAARSGGAGSSRPPAAVEAGEAEPPHAARVAAVTAAAERLRGAPRCSARRGDARARGQPEPHGGAPRPLRPQLCTRPLGARTPRRTRRRTRSLDAPATPTPLRARPRCVQATVYFLAAPDAQVRTCELAPHGLGVHIAIGALGGRSIDVPVDPAPIAGSPSEVDCFTDARDAAVGVWRLCWKLALAPSTGMQAVPVRAGM